MLYNKYTGVLRVFYYQFEDAGTGGEFSFVVTPDDASTAKYPFYSSLQYAIPVGNKDVQLKGNVLKATLGNNTFQQQVTPYVKADVVLKTGWYCFPNLATTDPFTGHGNLPLLAENSAESAIAAGSSLRETSPPPEGAFGLVASAIILAISLLRASTSFLLAWSCRSYFFLSFLSSKQLS